MFCAVASIFRGSENNNSRRKNYGSFLYFLLLQGDGALFQLGVECFGTDVWRTRGLEVRGLAIFGVESRDPLIQGAFT